MRHLKVAITFDPVINNQLLPIYHQLQFIHLEMLIGKRNLKEIKVRPDTTSYIHSHISLIITGIK